MTAAAMNGELHARYTAALRDLGAVWHPLEGDSKPMLIEVSVAYTEASLKLMVVGQEAGGWAKSVALTEGAVAALMSLYTDFDLGRSQRPFTPFWQGAWKVARGLGAASGLGSFLWSNLVKVDVGGRRPPAVVEAAVASLELVEQELDVTQPDAVVFFTGPRYDDRLKATCPGAAIEELGNGTAPPRCHVEDDPPDRVETGQLSQESADRRRPYPPKAAGSGPTGEGSGNTTRRRRTERIGLGTRPPTAESHPSAGGNSLAGIRPANIPQGYRTAPLALARRTRHKSATPRATHEN